MAGEGDSIHQIFDCMVLGPHSRVNFWDQGAAKDLEVPFWARDSSEEGIDRTMDLPCFGSKLKGDYVPPFTCGSDTRRSIIKYFVRYAPSHLFLFLSQTDVESNQGLHQQGQAGQLPY